MSGVAGEGLGRRLRVYLQGFDHFAVFVVVFEQDRVEDFTERFLLLEGEAHPRHEVVLAGRELPKRRPACEKL